MRTRRLTPAATAVTLAGGVLCALTAAGAGTAATPVAGPHHIALRATTATAPAHPATNVPPSPDYWSVCSLDGPSSSTCIDTELHAINNARALEGVGPMVLPAGFAQMSVAAQTFVVSNLERVDRGLKPAAGMVDTLDSLSVTAAQNDADPALASWTVGPFNANRWGSIWAGDLNALAADYDWMYNDGWGPSGSYNLDCSGPTAAGCWGHRDNIISAYGGEELITGVGSVKQAQWTSIAQIFVAGSGSYPAFALAWSSVVNTATTPVASGNAVTPTVDTTHATVTAPASVIAGQAAVVTGRIVDSMTGAGVGGAALKFCHRAIASSTSSCTGTTSDPSGWATVTAHPTTATYFWVSYAGSATLAGAASNLAAVHVRPALHLKRARTSSGWRVTSKLSPARGQVVRLQRLTSHGWVTVRKRTALSSFTFGRLRSGSYRVTVAGVSGLLSTSATIRCA